MDYINCSYGNLLDWNNLQRCVKDDDHLVGLIVGTLAIPLWSSAHISQYMILRSRIKTCRSTRILSFLCTHWLSDCIGVVSAFLAQQWLSQIIYGLCVLFIHTVCCIHFLIVPLKNKKDIVAIDKKLTVKHRSRLKSCPHMLSVLFLPAVILTIYGHQVGESNKSTRAMVQHTSTSEVDFEIPHIVGYTFGCLAGVLHCSTTLIDMIDSYITVESSACLIFAYFLRITGDCTYYTSVLLQNTTFYHHIHTLPWTIPRLVSAGLNIGILIQRIIQKKQGRCRKLSREDSECLLSSESEIDFHSDDSEEEVIWMPLKSVQSAIPHHPVCISRVQILSEADVPPEILSPVQKESSFSRGTEQKHENEAPVTKDDEGHGE